MGAKLPALQKIQALQDDLNNIIVERQPQVEAALAAIIAGVHVLFLGPPGTAKSMLADSICQSIDGATYFQWLVTKFSTPEELFGPISLKALENDSYRRTTTKKLPEAHISFIDEIFKANSAILNSLLTLINERKFHNDGQVQDVPLLSCFGASNELPQGEELGALYDRFLLRFWVEPIQSDSSFCDLLEGKVGNSKPKTKLTLQEIKELQEECKKVVVKRELLETIREIYHELELKGIKASDRRWKTSVTVLRAYALLRGLTEVSADELEVLADILWERPKDKKTILEVVAPRSNPLNLKALEFIDAAKEALETWRGSIKGTTESIQANGIIKEIVTKLKDEMKDRPETKTKKLREALGTIEAFRKEIISSLGVL